jgi:DNA-binding beta-propeller fold protein YncE
LTLNSSSRIVTARDTNDGLIYLVVATADGHLRKINATTGATAANIALAGVMDLAARDDEVYYATGTTVGKLALLDLAADTAFGTGGELAGLTSVQDIVLTVDGLFVAANNNQIQKRALANGALDPTFNGTGSVTPAGVVTLGSMAVNSTDLFVSYSDGANDTAGKYSLGTGAVGAFAPVFSAPATRLVATDTAVFALVAGTPASIVKMNVAGTPDAGFATAGELSGVAAAVDFFGRTRIEGKYYILVSDLTAAVKKSYSPTTGAVDGLDVLYVADAGNNNLRKFRLDGTNEGLEVTGATLPLTGQDANDYGFDQPYDVVVDSHGWVFVLDRLNNRIGRFFSDGTPHGTSGVIGQNFILPTETAVLGQPQALAIDANDNLYVADTGNDEIRVFRTDASWTSNDPTRVMTVKTVGGVALVAPRGVAVEPDGSVVYVADSGNSQVTAFTSASYNALTSAASLPAGSAYPLTGMLSNPTSVTLDDASGQLYVVEPGNSQGRNRLSVYVAGTGTTVNADRVPDQCHLHPRHWYVDGLGGQRARHEPA